MRFGLVYIQAEDYAANMGREQLTLASETCKAWNGRTAISGVRSFMFHSDMQAVSPWSSLFTSTLMEVSHPAPSVELLSYIHKMERKEGSQHSRSFPSGYVQSQWHCYHLEVCICKTIPKTKTEPTSTYSTYLCHLSPAPLFSLREPTHYLGSNVWNAVLLGIWTTGFPAAANERKIMTTRNMWIIKMGEKKKKKIYKENCNEKKEQVAL